MKKKGVLRGQHGGWGKVVITHPWSPLSVDPIAMVHVIAAHFYF